MSATSGSRTGRTVRPAYDQRPRSHARLAEHFFATFPQLEGLRFSHRWGGAIDTCTRFCAFYGTTHGGRVAYLGGHTGLGVGASRFGARVALDLLDGEPTELTQLRLTGTRPIPFPGWYGYCRSMRSCGCSMRTAKAERTSRCSVKCSHWNRQRSMIGSTAI